MPRIVPMAAEVALTRPPCFGWSKVSTVTQWHSVSRCSSSHIYGTLTNSDGENPIDYDAMMANPMETLTVITNAHTGEPRYVSKQELVRDRYTAFMASSAIPGVCRPICGFMD